MQMRSSTQRNSTRKRTSAAYCPERASRSKRSSLLALGSADVVLTRATTLILAAAAGIAVANLYYIQPVLELIARDFHAGAREAGWISLLMQLGYALGILLCVPLGDILERRTLSVALLRSEER